MASDWKETQLAGVMDVKHGFAFPGANIREEPPGDILVTPGNVAIGGGFKGDKFKYFNGEVPAEYILNEGDLVVTMTDLSKQADTLGYPALIPKRGASRFLHNQRIGKVLIKKEAELDKRFLFYLLRTAEYRHEVLASATGSTVKHTSPSRILTHKAKIPLLPEQKSIAAVLGTLDDRIELNRQMSATLEAVARALFQSWFVDFDPVHAKAAGRPPAGLDEPTAALFPAQFQDSEIGLIPQGWRVETVNDLTKFSRDSLTPANFPDEVFDHYSLPAFDEGRTPKTEPGAEIKSNKLTVPADAVLLSKLNPHIPRIWAPSVNRLRRAICSTEFLVALPTLLASREFLYCLFTSDSFSRVYGTLVTGTTGSHQRIKAETVLATRAVVPSAALLEKFTTATKPMLARINQNIEQSRTLATLRDTLLPKLLGGELAVSKVSL